MDARGHKSALVLRKEGDKVHKLNATFNDLLKKATVRIPSTGYRSRLKRFNCRL